MSAVNVKPTKIVLRSSSPMALFTPAKSHPEVVIQAIAARDREKAEKYAQSNNIPEVKNSYQGKTREDVSEK